MKSKLRTTPFSGWAPLLYAGLAVAVAGPLLGAGLVLSVDLAQTPRSPLPSAYWGLASGTNEGSLGRLPLDALFAGLGAVDAVAVGQKAMLLAIVFLAGWGMHRLVRVRRPPAALFAGLLYAVNPFVYDRLVTGQWALLLGYALIPHAYRALLRALEGRPRAAWAYAALFAAVGVASAHMAILLLGLGVLTVALHPGRRRGAVALTLGLLPSLLWLLPTPGLHDLLRHVGSEQLAFYRTVADGTWGLAATVAGLSGYWNNPDPIREFLSAWPLLALALVVLAGRGAALEARDPVTWAVALAGVAGFALALGDASALTGGTFRFLLDHVEPLRAFREPQKGVALLAFAYAYLGARGVDDLLAHAGRARAAAPVLAAAAIALPLLFGYRELGGLWGALEPSRFPASWSQADGRLRAEAATSRTLFLPWHGYLSLSFAGGRVVFNPAPQYFSTPILASRSVDPRAALADVTDPAEGLVRDLVDRPDGRPVGACLAGLGVSHVLLAHQADWRRYRYLDRRADLAVEARWTDLTLYRLEAPGSRTMTVPTDAGRCPPRPTALSSHRASPVRYELRQAPPRGRRLLLGLPNARNWVLGRGRVTYRPWGAYRRNYVIALLGMLAFGSCALFSRAKPAAKGTTPWSA